MKNLEDFLTDQMNGVLATCAGDMPDARPWQLQFIENNKLYFCTANTKEAYNQMKKNPYVVFMHSKDDGTIIRIYGKAEFTNDLETKKKILDRNPGLRDNIYKSADNPIFEAFYIEHGKVKITNFITNQYEEFEF